VDAAMNDLARPSLYGAYHEVEPVRDPSGRPEGVLDLVGPVCESADFLAQARRMAVPERGDLLCVRSAGAYGFSMSSNYNARPRAAEVLVEGEVARLARRRESWPDLIRGEKPLPAGRRFTRAHRIG